MTLIESVDVLNAIIYMLNLLTERKQSVLYQDYNIIDIPLGHYL